MFLIFFTEHTLKTIYIVYESCKQKNTDIFILKNKFLDARKVNVPDVSTTSRCHVHRWTGGLVQSHDAGSCDGGNCVSSCHPAEDVL